VTAADATVEARGVLCPVPIIRLARASSALPSGSVIELLTDDPAAEYDVPAWCRLRGHEWVGSEPLESDVTIDAHADPADTVGLEPHSPNENPGQAMRHLIRLATVAGSP
jgi:tRNA 2-thiouridine synthesizing protein A